jgi:hypothetical protein
VDYQRKYYQQNKEHIYFLMKKITHKRQRNLKFIELFLNPFPSDISVEYHHINNILTIPLPKITHRYVGGTALDKAHWKHNKQWIEKIYCLNIKLFEIDDY